VALTRVTVAAALIHSLSSLPSVVAMSAAAAGGVELTESIVKSKSRTFDLESIFTLQLRGCSQSTHERSVWRGEVNGHGSFSCVCHCVSLSDLRALHPCLNQCVDLCDLDLSSNLLSSISVLDGRSLSKLRRLNLSSNNLASLDSMPVLPALHTLRLDGNALRDSSCFAVLAERCPSLRALWIAANPVASSASYRADALRHLPSLEIFDGERLSKDAGASFYAEYAQLEKETAQYADANAKAKRESQELTAINAQAQVARKMEDWYPQGGCRARKRSVL
jgi:hypothetical protein